MGISGARPSSHTSDGGRGAVAMAAAPMPAAEAATVATAEPAAVRKAIVVRARPRAEDTAIAVTNLRLVQGGGCQDLRRGLAHHGAQLQNRDGGHATRGTTVDDARTGIVAGQRERRDEKCANHLSTP